ncbi:FtsH protease activity modulator HflK [Comamonas endophytica]|uniref:Protein HflK n=1 Tax=Comamonas endophytica TaxID=2949090 RepID=A0ABY6GDA6_9BURK|nr:MULTISPECIES: FtsH protease activity modulator HflK [unclassified Acidovorax]MCD2513708.1 FtsH protease activity modulator HflK [Acidovorax sp. D4N7]UYG52285.1 FtsH protease activity modulator HflK [Acidovorax sp. 5MLIR]
MNFSQRAPRWALLPQRLRGMFNLNDPRWGRGDDKDPNGARPDADRPVPPPSNGRDRQPQGTPPDLDELWGDLNRKLSGLFRGKNGGNGLPPGGRNGGGFQPDMKNAGAGIGLIVGVALAIWLATGFFIVQEGQQAVITQFGKYRSTVGAGFNWRLPYPIQRHETVVVSQIRSADVGRDNVIKSTGLRESAMLTRDENIVEIKFAVQYRLSDARAWLFESRNPADAVVQAAETAVREVVGKMSMDAAMQDERDQIAPRVRALMQTILDRYRVGVEVVGINLQQSGVRPPEQVQASFDDVLRAGQERERAKNEAQAYANDVVPRATGVASRMLEEAAGYKERIVAQAQGDAQRFSALQAEYQKAPQVTRERLYLESMQQIYGNVTKVLVDSRQGSNLLYLPLDKIMQATGQGAAPADAAAGAAATPAPGAAPVPAPMSNEVRARDNSRSRERDAR